jgi:hypothetical protein
MQSGLCISLELMSNSVRIGSLALLYYVLDSVYQSEVLCMLESTGFFFEGWQLPAEPVSEVDHHHQS